MKFKFRIHLSRPVNMDWDAIQYATKAWVAQILRAKGDADGWQSVGSGHPLRDTHAPVPRLCTIPVSIPKLRIPRAEAWRRLNEKTSLSGLKRLLENPAAWFHKPAVTKARIGLELVPESRSRGNR